MRISKNVLNGGLITFDVKANHQTTMYASASTDYSKGRLRESLKFWLIDNVYNCFPM